MRRREFIVLIGGAAVAWPLHAHAQQPTIPVIGFLHTATPDSYAPMTVAFRQGLSEAGYVEGRNVAVEYRWAENQRDRLRALAADLVSRQVVVIFAGGNLEASLVAKAATSTIPIVFANGSDPVADGLVASLNRPGGNVTGATFLITTLGQKKLELLHEVVPKAAVIAVLLNPDVFTSGTQLKDVQAAGRALGLQVHVLHASTERELDSAFASLTQLRAEALVVGADAFFNSRRDELVALAARHSIPTVYPWREAAAAGGLMSYGTSFADAYRQAGIYTGRILRGEKPADLPVQQSTKVELVINLKTAKTLGLTFPIPLLGRADEVIE
jgi:putative ABC transport system substrate-binding protein